MKLVTAKVWEILKKESPLSVHEILDRVGELAKNEFEIRDAVMRLCDRQLVDYRRDMRVRLLRRTER
jgi:hypothetical protein